MNRRKKSSPTTETKQLSASAKRLRALGTKTVDESSHLVIIARAGTGKTTTLVEGLKIVKGIESQFTPSPQQLFIWQEMVKSSGKAVSICFVAFNKSIATELQARVPQGCDAMTMHSMGFKAVQQAFGKLRVTQYRVSDLISEVLNVDLRELRKDQFVMVKAVQDLVGLCKQNVCNGTPEELEQLALYYDIELNGNTEKIFALVPQVLDHCKDVNHDHCIDFNDMIWLPVVHNLPMYKYDMLLVDEAQDLNRCQQQLALMAGHRIILCGDPKQAIYGFAGADAQSMPRMTEVLRGTNRGVIELPLTITRRCSKAVVDEARKIVQDFEAHETNSTGIVRQAVLGMTAIDQAGYMRQVETGNFILCRVNAPLVSQCFRFLKAGRKANIQGRDIGQGLIRMIEKFKAITVSDLMEKLDKWYHEETRKETSKRNPSEQKLIALQDKHECLHMFCEDAVNVKEIIDHIERIFSDTEGGGIRLSSIHKAKGLEARRVFLLQPPGATVPHPMAKSAWQLEQEMNLKYVAITRAIEEFVYVS